MKLELNVLWEDRPYWHRVAAEMINACRCPTHPSVDPSVTVVEPRGEAEERTVDHVRPVLWIYCGDATCKWWVAFDARALPPRPVAV